MDYNRTTKCLINHIHKSFSFGNDIGTAEEELQQYDMAPHCLWLQTSISKDAEQKEGEDKHYKLEFKAEFDAFMKHNPSLEVNTGNAYASPK